MATICIFGDSIAWGAVDPDGGGWATRLRNYFESHGLPINQDTDVYNLGVSGNNTDDLVIRFSVELKAREATFVIFAIGINDSQFVIPENKNRVSVERFRANLETMIAEAKNVGCGVALVGLTRVDESKTTPIPWNADKKYINADIEKYDQVLKDIADKEKLLYVDMNKTLSRDDLYDGLHPNTAGHKKIFEKIKEFLLDQKPA